MNLVKCLQVVSLLVIQNFVGGFFNKFYTFILKNKGNLAHVFNPSTLNKHMKTVTTNKKMFNITSYSGNNSYLRTANQERHLLLHRWQLMCKTESSNFYMIWEMSQN